ncbi:MAG: flagellar basal-body rod protein FlgB [Frankiaceae bacterium]|nr:flagellar basal-body rod protein FlgB [Frankiaceae bacterium]MDQ1634013.1 flagellar basal-body rod protein FlgB [Frankiaceae bacterium]MDQ1649310.1 flagellar basal-body rod protein FlgB [Frankiaceae bacterium]
MGKHDADAQDGRTCAVLTHRGPGVELFNDIAGASVERALDGVAAQQRATAANIANAATPGYRAQRVSFADNLASAIASGQDPRSAALSTQDANTPADLSGNTVQLNSELTNQQRESLQYQALAQAMSFKLGLWKSAFEK